MSSTITRLSAQRQPETGPSQCSGIALQACREMRCTLDAILAQSHTGPGCMSALDTEHEHAGTPPLLVELNYDIMLIYLQGFQANLRLPKASPPPFSNRSEPIQSPC